MIYDSDAGGTFSDIQHNFYRRRDIYINNIPSVYWIIIHVARRDADKLRPRPLIRNGVIYLFGMIWT